MREFLRLLSNNSVYLPDALCSHVSQISLARHLMMIATTKIVSEKLSSLSLLEIGSWLGASTLAWSHGINRYFPNGGKILCVDPWNQYLDKVEIEQKVKTLKMDEMARLGLAYECFLGFWLMRKTSLGYQKQEIEKAEMTLPSHIPDHMKNTLFKHLVSNKIRHLRKKAL